MSEPKGKIPTLEDALTGAVNERTLKYHAETLRLIVQSFTEPRPVTSAELLRVADFLESSPLADALALYEAVVWIEEKRGTGGTSDAKCFFHEVYEDGHSIGWRWVATYPHAQFAGTCVVGYGGTLPEAVAALRTKIKETRHDDQA